MRLILLLSFIFFVASCSATKNSDQISETATIKTSTVCMMCKANIENAIGFKKGVKDIAIDFEKQEIVVSYNPAKVSFEEIKEAIAASGYKADDLEPNVDAFNNLPACCRVEEIH